MENKTNLKTLIKKYISGELTALELESLLKEVNNNNQLSEIIRIHDLLSDPETGFEKASDKEFEKMRETTLNRIRINERSKLPVYKTPIFQSISSLFRLPAFNISLATVMFLFGYLINYNHQETDFIGSIKLTAQNSASIESSSDLPFIFSNATFRENPDGSLTINFDVSRHVKMKGYREDPLVREVLAQSLLNSKTESQRLRNIDDSKSIMDPKIKQALILTMLNDNNSVVRQKSLFSLIRYPNDNDIQDALLKVLKEEESVYMRLAAVDYLSNNQIDGNLLNNELDRNQNIKDHAIFERIKQLNYESNL